LFAGRSAGHVLHRGCNGRGYQGHDQPREEGGSPRRRRRNCSIRFSSSAIPSHRKPCGRGPRS
jgi:hypothetical protein